MRKVQWLAVLGLAVLAPAARAQRPSIGFVYPAGGQQGTTFQIRLGGQQGLTEDKEIEVNEILVSGPGVTVKSIEGLRRLNSEEVQLLNDQLRKLKRAKAAPASIMAPMMMPETSMMSTTTTVETAAILENDEAATNLIVAIEKLTRAREQVQTPASAALATVILVVVAIAPDAPPGEREIRLVTSRGVSNPLAFHVGQVPEFSRKPMRTATLQVLGKEAAALRKRPPEEVEDRIILPCTVNGQIASGEVNRYRFAARKGQRLMITTLGRQLIPYIADAVPGWFQPVLMLYNASGKEVAYAADYRFKPDPVILYEVPQDGEYVFAIRDALYRGREDFVYRITIGELPFVTSIFPLGGRVGEPVKIQMKGWNLEDAEWTPPAEDAGPGVYQLAATRKGLISNRVPFAMDTRPECFAKKPNNDLAHAQRVKLPIIINGRIDQPNAWDVFQFAGKAGDMIVAEVDARRLDSPLDSVLKLTDAKGTLLAFNDDHDDPGSGLNTHHADSYFMAQLPANGTYYVHIGDAAGKGGEEYAYRLHISAPQPDFALRVVPSSANLRSKDSTAVSVYAIRKDGFAAPIKLDLKDPPLGFSSLSATLSGTQAMTRLSVKTDLVATQELINLTIAGCAKVGDQEIAHAAVPAEDRMQAFLWRHLVPAQDLKVLVFDPTYQPPPKRALPVRPSSLVEAIPAVETNTMVAAAAPATGKPKFTKQQVASRLRNLKHLYEDGLLTDEFYWERVAECEVAQ